MNDRNEVWVLGHRVRLLETDGSYGMIESTSFPKVPGPPPHYHEHESEFFYIVSGHLDFVINGKSQTYGPGGFMELSPGTTHTFINNASVPAVWITGWRPSGFEKFFSDFGIPVGQENARDLSTSSSTIEKVNVQHPPLQHGRRRQNPLAFVVVERDVVGRCEGAGSSPVVKCPGTDQPLERRTFGPSHYYGRSFHGIENSQCLSGIRHVTARADASTLAWTSES